MSTIDPHRLYGRDELIGEIGRATFEAAQTQANLYAVGDRYLGQAVLDALLRAHENVARQRAAREGGTNEEGKMAAHHRERSLEPPSSRDGARDFLRSLA